MQLSNIFRTVDITMTERSRTSDNSVFRTESRGFTRTLTEIEWLLLLIVTLYLVSPGTALENRDSLTICLASFGFFVFFSNFSSFYRTPTPWKLALKTWVMIIFITWVVLNTGKINSPLIDLYLLVVIITALTLDKTTSLLQVGLISCCYLFLSYNTSTSQDIFTMSHMRDLATQLAPVWLIAYLTTMLSMDIKEAQGKIKLLSETDPLTGKLNMRAFSELLEQEAKRSARHNSPYALLMLDSDNLKSINDKYGHEAGDALIRFISKHAQNCLRQTDHMARFGGDEFAILLVESDIKGAEMVAERIREIIAETPFLFEDGQLKSSISLGIACYPEHGNEPKALLRKADLAMYYSKINGRNKVTTYSDEIAHVSKPPSNLPIHEPTEHIHK